MEAVPRLPMLCFDLKTSPESAQFGPALKQYIANFYNEDPESYNAEISRLEALRGSAVRPTNDVGGCQLLKKYYCQLHFLKSRFPMNDLQAAAVYFSWKDTYSNMPCSVPDIRFELMCVLFNVGAQHTQLGALDSRTSAEGLKMACTHFQCAAWAFQTVKETYFQVIPYITSVEVIHFMQQVCLAQAQECILEKSMMDNRKATITAKVAVQVVDFYKRALALINTTNDDETSFSNLVGSKITKEWSKYLSFKVAYHKCLALLFQGQQAEEQQKMGERVAFYQAACEQLEEARKLSSGVKQQKDLMEAIAFTTDVVEGKRKAAKNENEFIYHEEVPERHVLQEVKGASLVKGIAFNVNDHEVSGDDIFARLVPMEAHESSSLYSEQKAQKLRQLGELVEVKDQALAEFMSSLQLDIFSQMRQATGITQDLIDRAAALSAKPNATQDLIGSMSKLSNSYQEVESMLNDIQELLKEEDDNEKKYQEMIGKRPPSMIATDLSREASKYREAHTKANESNQNLHRAMMTHVANLKMLSQPLRELQKQIPSIEFPNPNIDENAIREIEGLIAKIDEMRKQRAMLWTQFREAVHNDDITSVLVTRQADQPLDQLFQEQLAKHQELASIIEQNIAAQDNIIKAFVDSYARIMPTRRYLQDVINRRSTTIAALITSFDTYEDLLAKAHKGIEFYGKLETNVSKLLQRIKSATNVQQEERDQMMKSTSVYVADDIAVPPTVTTPKLKDYLENRKKVAQWGNMAVPSDTPAWPRPTPLGSEVNEPPVTMPQEDLLANRFANLKVTYNQNKQAFTMTTDMYQPISSVTPEQQYINYGQTGYTQAAMNYDQSYPVSNYSDQVLNYGQANQPLSQNYEAGYNQAASTYHSQVNSYNLNPPSDVFYPQGYSPSVVQQPSPSYQYSGTFGSNEYATSVKPNTTINLTSTYSSPIVDMKSSASSSSSNYVMSNGQNYPSYDSTAYYQYYYGNCPNGYNYVTPEAVPVTTKESNIDLLTGLDFTVNQAPLVPQQRPVEIAKEPPKIIPTTTKEKDELTIVPQQTDKIINRKAMNNSEIKKLFELELDRFEKFVDVLKNKTLNGPTNLDLKWKEILDRQELDKKTISVARCYPMKNRFPDILPYDYSRVELRQAKDDYINASFSKDISYYSAPFIITQSPLPSTISDFWTMITEQQCELVVSLLSDGETGGDIYWPNRKGNDLMFSDKVISLMSHTVKPYWVERIISIGFPEKRESRTIMHLQFTAWPGSLFPSTPDAFVVFLTEICNVFLQQRSTSHPIVVHCLSGIGRSGLVCLLVAAILEVTSNPVGIPDLVALTVKLGAARKNILRDREHLKFAYEAFLTYMKLVIAQGQAKRILNDVGIAAGVTNCEETKVPVDIKLDDPLSSLDPFWASKKGGN